MELIGQANETRHTLSPKLNLYFLQKSFEKFLYFLYFYIIYIFSRGILRSFQHPAPKLH